MTKLFVFKDFIPHLRTHFEVTGDAPVALELTSATDLSNARLEQFSLIFSGSASPYLMQGLYELTHPRMGKIELFLVPLGQDEVGMRYEAVFSRFLER